MRLSDVQYLKKEKDAQYFPSPAGTRSTSKSSSGGRGKGNDMLGKGRMGGKDGMREDRRDGNGGMGSQGGKGVKGSRRGKGGIGY